MAEDVIVLLEYLRWTGNRELHVVGISLGGMISQGILLQIVVACRSSINDPV
jgi:esterase/lipase